MEHGETLVESYAQSMEAKRAEVARRKREAEEKKKREAQKKERGAFDFGAAADALVASPAPTPSVLESAPPIPAPAEESSGGLPEGYIRPPEDGTY